MKRKTAKEILADSFRELAERRAVDRITIKDITDNCGYSTATFYRQFKDKYDLIAWDYTRDLAAIMAQLGEAESNWNQTLADAAHFFDNNKEYLANLFLHTSGLDSFISYMREINFDSLKNSVKKITGQSKLDAKLEMYIRAYVLGNVQFTCEWILGEHKGGPAVLADVYANTLPEALKPYLA